MSDYYHGTSCAEQINPRLRDRRGVCRTKYEVLTQNEFISESRYTCSKKVTGPYD